MRAVLDTNVLLAGLRSQAGASYEVLRLLRVGKWKLVLSNTVLGEYHEILHRESAATGLSKHETDAFLDALCLLAEKWALITPWQPVASDPEDEPFVQLAREAAVPYLVTYNIRDLAEAKKFGVTVLPPALFLELLRKAV
jgi:putative PIN family toxin of toxin-antitoxin system